MEIRNPALTFNFHFYPCDAALFYPFARQQVEHPLLVAPAPAARGLDILEECRSLGTIACDTGRCKWSVGRRTEYERFVFAICVVQGAVLQFENLDFTRLGVGLQLDIFGEVQQKRPSLVFLFGEEVLILGGGEEVLYGWVTEDGEGVAEGEEDEPPGK